MNVPALSRKDRRALQSEAAKVYGIDGPAAVTLHEAYVALSRRDTAIAAQLAGEVREAAPKSAHPWSIFGLIALDRHEAESARRFFEEARRLAPGDPLPLAGLGKALVLKADPYKAVEMFEAALEAGSGDRAMIRLYKDLMQEMDRHTRGAEVLEAAAQRLKDPTVYHLLGEICLDAEEYSRAIDAFDAEYELAPETVDSRVGQVKAALFRHDFATACGASASLLFENPGLDEVISLRMMALRNLGRDDEALALLDAPFTSPICYKRALGVAAHIHLDRGDSRTAGHLFRTAHALTDEESLWSARAYGTWCFSEGRMAEGAPFYAGRQPEVNRRKIPYESSAPENLSGRKRLFLMQEQGIGDQLALLPLIALAPLAAQAEVTFVGDPRMEAVLAGNTLGLAFRSEEDFAGQPVTMGDVTFVGDLARYLDRCAPGQVLGGYLHPDPQRVARLSRRYCDKALGAPVVGLAWRSGDRNTGWHRSVPLEALVATLPRGALAVNLQYGDCTAEIAAAQAARPDITFFDDPEIDQMADLSAFMVQIMALERIVTIDNTTAHAAGALGHPKTHVLIPEGAECMWYWGRKGTLDPWYGNLHLHRQTAPRDWAAPLAGIAAAFAR